MPRSDVLENVTVGITGLDAGDNPHPGTAVALALRAGAAGMGPGDRPICRSSCFMMASESPPFRPDSDVAIWTIEMAPHAKWTLPAAAGDKTRRTLYFFEGESVRLGEHELTGEPILAMAPGHEPRILRPELLIELMRTQGRYAVELDETSEPDLALYVRYQGQAIAHLPSGEDLGPVPGVILVPIEEDGAPPTTLEVFDERTGAQISLSLESCTIDHVCLLAAIPGTP